MSLSLYASVISWIYAFGTILALVQDRTFQDAIAENRFARHIRKMREPFHLVCGYGETGSALVQALTWRGQHAVVIDIDETRTNIIPGKNDYPEEHYQNASWIGYNLGADSPWHVTRFFPAYLLSDVPQTPEHMLF